MLLASDNYLEIYLKKYLLHNLLLLLDSKQNFEISWKKE